MRRVVGLSVLPLLPLLPLLALAALAALAGCAARDGSPRPGIPEAAPSVPGVPGGVVASPSAGTTTSDLPACSAVWVAGRTLPSGYSGCSAQGRVVEGSSTSIACADGGRLVAYDDRWWVLTPGRIAQAPHGLDADLSYTRAHDACLLS